MAAEVADTRFHSIRVADPARALRIRDHPDHADHARLGWSAWTGWMPLMVGAAVETTVEGQLSMVGSEADL